MPPAPLHRIIAAHRRQVPRPFRAFAVRSEEPCHATDARSPWHSVHLVQAALLDAATLAILVAEARTRVVIEPDADVGHARSSLGELAALAPGAAGLPDGLAAALQHTGVLDPDATAYRRALDTRIDFLGARGAGFHNDVSRHWPACLFWLLTLLADDVEFVMPHAGVRIALAPGDLLVFDPAMAHGLCRPRDAGQAVGASFTDEGVHARQYFLTGELPLTDAQWAALGSPWRPVAQHALEGALDLLVAEFDERSGAIKQLRQMGACMQGRTEPGPA